MADSVLLRDFMTTNVVTGLKTESIVDIALRMKEKRIGVIVIVDKKNKIQGLVSERDILNKVVAAHLDAKSTTAEQVMTKQVILGKPSMTDVEAASIFSQKGIKKLPIIDKGKLVGIITQTDLLKLYSFKWAL